jgi:chromosome segregation ATPase
MSNRRQSGWLSRTTRQRLHDVGTRWLDDFATRGQDDAGLEETVERAQRQLQGLSQELLDAHARINELDGELSQLRTGVGQPGAAAPAPTGAEPAHPPAPPSEADPAHEAAPAPAAATEPGTNATQVGEILALLEDQVISLEQRVTAFDRSLKGARDHAGTLERRLAEGNAEAKRLREQVQELGTLREQLQELDPLREQVSELHRESELREKELESTTAALESALVDLAEVRSGSGLRR